MLKAPFPRSFSNSLFLLSLLISSPAFSLEIANDTGLTLDIKVAVHPTGRCNDLCNTRPPLSFYNVLTNYTKTVYPQDVLCAYDIQFSPANANSYIKCPAAMGYSGNYRVILGSISTQPIQCYAYPVFRCD